jgi:hypothetical protein
VPEQIDVTTIDPRIKDALLAILTGVETEDQYLRLQQLRQFKKNNLFWHGFQYLFWSDVDQDWRVPTREQFEEIGAREETRYIFDYVINIFKAHGESIIAALSADIPDVKFGPRDAQDPSDHRAVESADNGVELIEKWNRAKLLIINALFYLSTEGFVASYTYNRKDPAYGNIKVPQYGTQLQDSNPDTLVCNTCGYTKPMDSTVDDNPPSETQDVTGGDGMASVHSTNDLCPQCGQQLVPEEKPPEEVPVITGNRLIPKGREIIEIYGALSVRVPSYVTKQADAGSLIHYVDADPALFKETFENVAEDIDSDSGQSYERIMRQTSLSMEGYQLNTKMATQKRCWFRPWMLRRLDKTFEDVTDAIRKMYPDGIYCAFIGDVLCETRNESMDKHWTLTKAGPSKGIHSDPLLQSLVPLQEIHNNLLNQVVMQVEYGIPATYADPEVYDFEGQSKMEVSPGYVYPAKPRPGSSLGDSFYTEKTTNLSKEVTQLFQTLEGAEQFCSGSFPSIFGGPSQSGSKTLGEYEKSRSFALQRLSLVWYFINVWYGETMHKSLLSFIDHQIEDEPLTSQVSPGSWQTKWVRKADLKGSFDRLEPDVSSDFPMSFAQKRSVLMTLMQLNSPEINSVLFSPENAQITQSYVGLTELKIPLASQRNKQMREILILIGMEPMEPQVNNIVSTVPVEPLIDDNEVHMSVLTEFLVSDAGQDLKQENPAGYANCLAHFLEHKNILAMQMPPPGATAPPGKNGPEVKPPDNKGLPAQGPVQ